MRQNKKHTTILRPVCEPILTFKFDSRLEGEVSQVVEDGKKQKKKTWWKSIS
jgi:hypothetical protein